MTDSTDVPMIDLPNRLNSLIISGYGVVCMYVTEAGILPRSMHTLLRNASDIVHIVTALDSNAYPSMSSWMRGLDPYEREMEEMSGLAPQGLVVDNPQRLMWRYADGYPMQKGALSGERVGIPIRENGINGIGVFEIPVGPVHAGIIGSGHFRFSVAGEPILRLKVHLGYTRRGIEKMLETPVCRNNTHLVERVAGDNAVAYALAHAHAIEGDADVPYRAKLIRVVFAELERIGCHLNDIGGMALDTGFSIPAVTCAGLREKILRLNMNVSGSRFLMGTVVPGGVRKDITEEGAGMIRNRILKLGLDLEGLMHMLTNSASFTDRTESTGVLSHDMAQLLRAVGPVSRASGMRSDVRKDRPYDAYTDLSMKIATSDEGDVYARLKVKANEIVESADLINQCLDRLEGGPIRTDIPAMDGFGLGLVESPRGELMHAIHAEDGCIWRYKIRDPSFINWIALENAVSNNIVPDFPLINKSFNLSYGGNDL